MRLQAEERLSLKWPPTLLVYWLMLDMASPAAGVPLQHTLLSVGQPGVLFEKARLDTQHHFPHSIMQFKGYARHLRLQGLAEWS